MHVFMTVTCPPLDNLDNGNTTLATNGTQTKALFHCDLGTSLSGLVEIGCTDEGVWDGNVPVCGKLTYFVFTYKIVQCDGVLDVIHKVNNKERHHY